MMADPDLVLRQKLIAADERAAATAEILSVIAESPAELAPIFEAIAERSNKLLSGLSTAVLHLDGDVLHLRAFTRRGSSADAALTRLFPCRIYDIPWYERTIREARPVHVIDTEEQFATDSALLELSRRRGFRSVLLVPLLLKATCVGLISVTRTGVGQFNEDDVGLLETFAGQAVIAIQNAELFKKLQAKTRELSQSLDDLRAVQDRLVQTEKLASLGPTYCGYRPRDQEPAQFCQQLLGPFSGANR